MFLICLREQPTSPAMYYTGHGWSRRKDQAYHYATMDEANVALKSSVVVEEPAENGLVAAE